MGCYEDHLSGNTCMRKFNLCAACPNLRTPTPKGGSGHQRDLKEERKQAKRFFKITAGLAVAAGIFVNLPEMNSGSNRPTSTEHHNPLNPIDEIIVPAWNHFSAPWLAREYTFSNGDHFLGTLDSNRRPKKGTYTYANGNKYEGEFLNGRFHGTGNLYYITGQKYSGEWENGKENGPGVFHSSTGDIFSGHFVDGTFPYGKKLHSDGSYYVGSFQDGYFHGQGTLVKTITTNPDNHMVVSHSGEWIQGELPYGTLVFDDKFNVYYVGELDDNLVPTGEGKMFEKETDRLVASGTFEYAELNGAGTLYLNNNQILSGTFDNHIIQGIGTLTFANGSTYVGEFENNKVSGAGTYTNSHGEEFTGTFYIDEDNEIHMRHTDLWNYLDWHLSRD